MHIANATGRAHTPCHCCRYPAAVAIAAKMPTSVLKHAEASVHISHEPPRCGSTGSTHLARQKWS